MFICWLEESFRHSQRNPPASAHWSTQPAGCTHKDKHWNRNDQTLAGNWLIIFCIFKISNEGTPKTVWTDIKKKHRSNPKCVYVNFYLLSLRTWIVLKVKREKILIMHFKNINYERKCIFVIIASKNWFSLIEKMPYSHVRKV